MNNLSLIYNSTGGVETKAKLKLELVVIGIVYSFACLWLFSSLVLAEVRSRKKDAKSGSKKTWDYSASRILAIISVAFSFIRFFVKTVLIFKPNLSPLSCQIWFTAGIISIPMSSVFIYGVLFIRQHVLYRSVAIRRQVNVVLAKVAAISVFSFYILVSLAFMVYYIFFTTIKVREDKLCTITTTVFPVMYIRLLYVVTMCVTQLTLVGLILYPLLRHYLFSDAAANATSNKFRDVILKLFVVSVVCVVTDIMTWSFVVAGIGKSIVPSLVNTSILINIFAIVFTFKDWKAVISPCSTCSKKVERMNKDQAQTEPDTTKTQC